MEDPTWRKANFLWKFLCAGGAFPTAAGTPSPPQSPRKDFCRAKMPCGGEDCQICCSAVWSLYELQTSLQLQSRKRVLAKTVEDARPVRQYKTRPPGIAQGSADPCVFTRQRKKQLLRGGSTPRFFSQIRSVGSKKDQLAGLCQSLPWSPDHRSGSKKYLDLFTNYL